MAGSLDTRYSFLNSHGGPGSRKQHDLQGRHPFAPLRCASLPTMNIPAGHSAVLGNQLGLQAYANLRGPFVARRDVPILPKNPRAIEREIYKGKVEEVWIMPEKLRPETLPPAGQMKVRFDGWVVVMVFWIFTSKRWLVWGFLNHQQ
eukprot:symbB.v1.2.036895.t1/scaffold5317.1/size28455/1